MIRRTRRYFLSLFLFANLAFSQKVSLAQETLFIGAIPDQNPEKLNRLYKLLSSELSQKLNVPVKYLPVTNYSATVSAFRTGSLDLVWFGGLTGVQARIQKPGAKVIAQRDIDPKFHSLFISNTNTGIPTIKNESELKVLKGKRLTFGSESSTSGRLMPQYFLQKAGLKMVDFKGKQPGFSGSHDATLALVQSGSYEVGALNEQVWKSNVKKGKVNLNKVKIIWKTPPYADYHWLIQPNLDIKFEKGFTEKLTKTLLGLNQNIPNQKKILDLFGAKKFIPAHARQYKKIEIIGRQLGKIK